MTTVGRRFHGREPSERPRSAPHRTAPRARGLDRRGPARRLLTAVLIVGIAVGVGSGCGGGPGASVGVTRVDGDVEIRAKACDDGGIVRVDVVDPSAPDVAVWSAVARTGDDALRAIPVAAEVPGYDVDDRRPDGALPDRRLRVLVEGPDGASWGGPRFTSSALREGVLRVAGQDVPLDEWEAEPARCPEVGLAAALVGGVVTAAVAGLLWLVVRTLARAVRRDD